MSLFSIRSIESFSEELDLLDIFKNMHLKGWNRFLYGDPYISLEKIIQDKKTQYYVAIPKKYEEILTNNPHVLKALTSKVRGSPRAVGVENDYLPQNKQCAVLYFHKKQPSIKFGDLKLNEEEGVVLQILARHIHDGPGHFESNVRVLAWADSRDRARRILNLKKINNRFNRKTVFDFFSRIFENGKRVKLSLAELKDFLINKFVY